MGFDSKHLMPLLNLPARFYVHTSGQKAFNVRPESVDPLVEARVFATRVVRDNKKTLEKYDFVIGVLRSDDEGRIADIFGYHGITDWPGNPDVNAFVYREGKGASLREGILPYEDTMILLGHEGDLRRNTRNLAEYLLKSPGFQTIGPEGIILQPRIVDSPTKRKPEPVSKANA